MAGSLERLCDQRIFLENYWNDGSVKEQTRWFDDFVISTHPIGPILATTPPVVTRTPVATGTGWELEVAGDPVGTDVVWRPRPTVAEAMNLTIDLADEEFCGTPMDKTNLTVGQAYWTRIRRHGEMEWPPWHVPFRE